MPNSICPKGWRLPPDDGNKSFNTLIRDAYQIVNGPSGSLDVNLLNNSAMSFVRLGHYRFNYGSLDSRSSYGSYWSSIATTPIYSYLLRFNSTEFGSYQYFSNRAYGLSIRCVSR